MNRLIKNRQIVEDSFFWLKLNDGQTARSVPLAEGPLIVPLSVWQERKQEIGIRSAPTGIWLDAAEGPELLNDILDFLPVIGVHFPKFTDGRAYSTAHLLRERFGYQGEIRALGDVLHDQLYLMARCGFNAFALRADQDIDKALRAFDTFSTPYQAASDQSLPLFQRRSA